MEEKYITQQVYEEFARRMDAENQRLHDENTRQNKRLGAMETTIQQINALTVSVERMAVNMENMLEVLKKQGDSIKGQGERIGKLEIAPADEHKQLKTAVATTIVTAIAGAIVGAVLMLL